jgi:hypothetical protein
MAIWGAAAAAAPKVIACLRLSRQFVRVPATPPGNQPWQWKIPVNEGFNGKIIYKKEGFLLPRLIIRCI